MRVALSRHPDSSSPSSRRGAIPYGRWTLGFGGLAVIALVAVILVGAQRGAPSLVPLGGKLRLNTASHVHAVTWLNDKGERWADGEDGGLLVPPNQRAELLADLSAHGLLEESFDLNRAVEGFSPFADRDTRQKQYLVAKMNAVARMVRALPGIERAEVVIDDPGSAGVLRRRGPAASAAVTVHARGPLGPDRVRAIANIVAGAHAPLAASNVTIVDGWSGTAVSGNAGDTAGASPHLVMQRAREAHARASIEQVLRGIPGTIVSVLALVDGGREEIEERSIHEPRTAVEEQVRMQSPGISGSPFTLSGTDDGMLNDSAQHGLDGATAGTSTRTRHATEFGQRIERRVDPGGYAVQINASILVPDSYVDAVAVRQGRSITTERARAELVDSISQSIDRIVAPLVETDPEVGGRPGRVTIATYPDQFLAGSVDVVPLSAVVDRGTGMTEPSVDATRDDVEDLPGSGTSTIAASKSSAIAALLGNLSITAPVGFAALGVVILAIVGALMRRGSRGSSSPQETNVPHRAPAPRPGQHAATRVTEVMASDRDATPDRSDDLRSLRPDEVARVLEDWIRPEVQV